MQPSQDDKSPPAGGLLQTQRRVPCRSTSRRGTERCVPPRSGSPPPSLRAIPVHRSHLLVLPLLLLYILFFFFFLFFLEFVPLCSSFVSSSIFVQADPPKNTLLPSYLPLFIVLFLFEFSFFQSLFFSLSV